MRPTPGPSAKGTGASACPGARRTSRARSHHRPRGRISNTPGWTAVSGSNGPTWHDHSPLDWRILPGPQVGAGQGGHAPRGDVADCTAISPRRPQPPAVGQLPALAKPPGLATPVVANRDPSRREFPLGFRHPTLATPPEPESNPSRLAGAVAPSRRIVDRLPLRIATTPDTVDHPRCACRVGGMFMRLAAACVWPRWAGSGTHESAPPQSGVALRTSLFVTGVVAGRTPVRVRW
jgi:hypothetical protein